MTFQPDTQLRAARGDKHGSGMWISLAVIGLALVVLLVLPGFLAAGFSRMGPHNPSLSSSIGILLPSRLYGFSVDGFFCGEGSVCWDETFAAPMPAWLHVEMAVLTPSGLLMRHSPYIRRFYSWQYLLAGGVDLHSVATL